ncbi:tigger transposable element-derived protein 6-like [Aphis craccivora]|uniref:Tigger transposable element-derived protein 6-like n=1 Tax=Aphis craccivora TaxID=307492 RepID=A0A6G0ZIG5_APHCR|nr:tigger transposable element-derived protein 6-like [Aphis craccivora]
MLKTLFIIFQSINQVVNVLSVVNTKMTRNFKTLTIREKRRVLEKLKSGRKKKEIVEEFGIPGNRFEIFNRSEEKKRPRIFGCKECVVKWFT